MAGVYHVAKVAQLPAQLAPNTLYLVLTGAGFDFYVSDKNGLTAKPLNALGAIEEVNPTFTYAAGLLSRIDYESGNHKIFTYTTGRLVTVDYVLDTLTIRKQLTYNPDGTLASIDQSVIP